MSVEEASAVISAVLKGADTRLVVQGLGLIAKEEEENEREETRHINEQAAIIQGAIKRKGVRELTGPRMAEIDRLEKRHGEFQKRQAAVSAREGEEWTLRRDADARLLEEEAFHRRREEAHRVLEEAPHQAAEAWRDQLRRGGKSKLMKVVESLYGEALEVLREEGDLKKESILGLYALGISKEKNGREVTEALGDLFEDEGRTSRFEWIMWITRSIKAKGTVGEEWAIQE